MRKLLYPILSVGMAFWYSCTSPLEGVTLQLPRALSQSNIIIEYQPANLSEDEKLMNANVVIGGPDSAKIVNITGGKTYKIKHNVLTLAANPNLQPSASSPLKFSVILEADGYVKSIVPIILSSTEDKILKVHLSKINTASAGVTITQKDVVVPVTGITNISITTTTPVTNGIQEKASVTVPSGITMKDESGNTVGGSLTFLLSKTDASKTYVNLNYSEVEKVVDKNNKPILNFKISPVVGLDIQVSNDKGQKVKTFTGEIEVKTEIPIASKNIRTGKPLQEGDLMTIVSFDEDTKILKYEGYTKLVKNSDGKLEAKATINHLTEVYFTPPSGLALIGDPTNPSTMTEAENTFQVVDKLNFINYEFEEIVIKQPETLEEVSPGYYLYNFNDIVSLKYVLLDNNKNKLYELISTIHPSFPDPITGGYKGKPSFIEVYDMKGTKVGESTLTYSFSSGSGQMDGMGNFVSVFKTIYYFNLEFFIPNNTIELQANLKCTDPSKSVSADNFIIQAKNLDIDPTVSEYFYVGKAKRDPSTGLITGSTNLLNKGGLYDIRIIVGDIFLYYPKQRITSTNIQTINSSMPSIFCK